MLSEESEGSGQWAVGSWQWAVGSWQLGKIRLTDSGRKDCEEKEERELHKNKISLYLCLITRE